MSSIEMSGPVPMTRDAVETFLQGLFPHGQDGCALRVEDVGPSFARLSMETATPPRVPPGATLRPAIMALADAALQAALLASIGPPAACVTNLSFTFFEPCEDNVLEAECRLVKLGRRLAVGEVAIRSGRASSLVGHATGTLAIAGRCQG